MLRHKLSFWLWLFFLGASPLFGQNNPPVSFRSGVFSYTLSVDQAFDLDLITILSSPGSGSPLQWATTGTLPPWLTLDSPNHRLSGKPAAKDVGYSQFSLFVQDLENGASTLMQFTVSGSPVWSNQSINLGVQFENTPWQTDLNNLVVNPLGGPLTFAATNLPGWMSLSSSGILSGTPKSQDVGPYTNIHFTATGAGGSSNATGFGLVLAASSKLALGGPLSIAVQSCRKYSVLLQNSDGTALATSGNLNVSLSTSGAAASGVQLYSSCGGSPIQSISIQAGQSSADFYAVGTVQGPLVLQGTFSPLAPASLSVQVTAPLVPSLVLSNPDGKASEVVGTCVQVNLSAKDADGNAYVPSTSSVVSLTTSRTDLTFYSDAACSASETSLTLPAGSGAASLYARATIAEAKKTMFASSPNYTSGSLTLTFLADAPQNVKIATAQSTIPINTCTAATVSLIDRFNNPATSNQATSMALVASGASASGAQFFSDSVCQNAESNFILPVGQSGGQVYFSSSQPGDLTLSATPPAPIQPGQTTVEIYVPAQFMLVGAQDLNFGNVVLQQTKTMTLTVKNTGGTGTLNNISETGDGFSILSSSTCSNSLSLPNNVTCTVDVQFAPVAKGAYQGHITLATNNGNVLSQLQGMGVEASHFVFQGPADLDFGDVLVSQTKDLSLTLQNTGGDGVLSSLVLNGSTFSLLPSSTCKAGLAIAANQSCTLWVRFSPPQAGAASGSIQWGTDTGTLTSNLSGNGTLPAGLSFVGASDIDFGSVLVGASLDKSVTLVASGSAATLSSVSLSGSGFTLLPSSTCSNGAVLPVGNTCRFDVRFSPNAAGDFSASMSVAYNGGSSVSHLTGVGVQPGALVFNPVSLDFGAPQIGSTQTSCVTVANAGQSSVTLVSLSMALGINFSLQSGAGCGPIACGAGMSLAPQAQCAFHVSYTATGTSVVHDTVKVDANSMGKDLPYSYAVQGAGSVPPPPPPAPTAVIYANGMKDRLVIWAGNDVGIAWSSTNASQCTVEQNDFSHRYPVSSRGGFRAGNWSGPSWNGTSNAGVLVPANSEAMFHFVTYTLTCQGTGGVAKSSVTVQPWVFAAGGPDQVAYLVGSFGEAQACASNITSSPGAKLIPACQKGRWGSAWVDGTKNPWTVKTGAWCTCLNPKTSPSGKPWAIQNGVPAQ